jgi:glycosyltransferase involved in cell wall biosynthesis
VNENRIKVLKFLNHFYIGGTERQFVHVANGLDASRFDVEIGCLHRAGPLLQSLRAEIPVHQYAAKGGFYRRRSILNQLRLARDIRTRRMDIIHAYGWYPNVFAIPPARLAFRPITIASIRDTGVYLTRSKIRALKLACALADCVLANSSAGRDWLLEQSVRKDKIEVIRNGIAVPAQVGRKGDGNGIRKEFGIPAETKLCACIGRAISGKGMDFYLQAARALCDEGRDVRFLVIGAISVEKSYKSEMEELARKLNLQGSVIFTGQREDVADILRDVDIVVHPSLSEGLSNVILEAMAAAIPVVATRVGGTPELVRDGVTGLLVPPGNESDLARAIARFLDDPALARGFGDAARKRVIQEFSIERMLRQTEDLYWKLWKKSRR